MSSLISLIEQATKVPQPDFKITETDYFAWKEGFLFETLQYGLRYGQSFCNRFDITDYILYYMRDITSAEKHIRKYYVQ